MSLKNPSGRVQAQAKQGQDSDRVQAVSQGGEWLIYPLCVYKLNIQRLDLGH